MTGRTALRSLAVLGVAALAWAAPTTASEEGHHSGTVVTVDASGRELVIRELAEEGRARNLALKVSAEAQVVFSERLPDAEVRDPARPFRDTPIDVADLRPGDFVVVRTTGAADALVATRVVVTLRAGAS